MKRRFVIYRRVSTLRQLDGYSLEAQMRAVECYLGTLPLGYEIVATVDEQETGADDDRPKLKEAIQLAQREGLTILIAKLDRIGRSLPLLYMLIAAKIDFVAADNPSCDIFSAKIMMLMAERERELIGARTRAGLAVAKSMGVKLGAPYQSAVASLKIGRNAIQERKRAFAESALKKIREIESTGITSKYRVCQYLNLRGETTAMGKRWTITAIRRVEAAAK